MTDRHSIPCGTLADEASDLRADKESPALLHGLSRRERAAFEAVQFYLRREPRATELRACKDLDVDFELYLAAKGKAVAGPAEWAKCSAADLIRPGSPILSAAKGPRGRGKMGRPVTAAERAAIALRDRSAIESVQAYKQAHPHVTVRAACLALGLEYRIYDNALKRRYRLKAAAAEKGEAS